MIPKVTKKRCIARSKCHPRFKGHAQKLEVETLAITFDTKKYRKEVVACVRYSDAVAKKEVFLVTPDGKIDAMGKCIDVKLPSCIRPRHLEHLKHEIERKIRKSVCMYITKRCSVYVSVGNRLYKVIFNKHGRRTRIRFCKVRWDMFRRLAKRGLFNVEFESVDTHCK